MTNEEKEVLAALKDFEKGMNERFDGIEKRFDRIDEKTGGILERIDKIGERTAGISSELRKMLELLREQNRKLDEDNNS
ncbi:hypothetical protein P4489_19610 [Heyndrickxia sporothermodurans]|uniref:hypothetical protein n=1 Tax=Heyndrickxia sporothermodurans TaxID=46224 RepID=UPI002E1D370D|nr:hypothetical protein [Heyndrickxia sporothermodurans]